jgi:hypothetical protein
MKKLYWSSVVYMIIGLLMGAFYREFTKMNNFEGKTVLSSVHAHSIALGFTFFIIVMILEKQFKLSDFKFYNSFFTVYNLGLIVTLITFTLRGIVQVLETDIIGLNYIAGLGHAILAAGVTLFFMNLYRAISKEQAFNKNIKNKTSASI